MLMTTVVLQVCEDCSVGDDWVHSSLEDDYWEMITDLIVCSWNYEYKKCIIVVNFS